MEISVGEEAGYLYSQGREQYWSQTMTVITAIESIAVEIKAVETTSVNQAPLTHCEHI